MTNLDVVFDFACIVLDDERRRVDLLEVTVLSMLFDKLSQQILALFIFGWETGKKKDKFRQMMPKIHLKQSSSSSSSMSS